MSSKIPIGGHQLTALSFIGKNPDGAFLSKISEVLGCDSTALGSVIVARLREKGLISCAEGKKSAGRGRPRIYYKVTKKGQKELDYIKELVS
jgi:predicted transcriptional regulator